MKVAFLSAQFDYRMGLGCTDALQTISQQLQKALDRGQQSYLVQLGIGTVFDNLSWWPHLHVEVYSYWRLYAVNLTAVLVSSSADGSG